MVKMTTRRIERSMPRRRELVRIINRLGQLGKNFATAMDGSTTW